MPAKSKKNSQLREIWRCFKKNRAAMIGLVVFALIIFVAIFADLIVPYEKAIATNRKDLLTAPCSQFIFGTDDLGRDYFARIIHGSRASISVAIVVSAASLIISSILGGIADYYGGRVDNIMMRILDIFMCIPQILLALAVVAALGSTLTNLCIALTISSIPGNVRLIRSTIINVSENDYIEAARSYGAGDARIILKYIIPNAIGPIIVNTTIGMANMILSAASLSFLGMGVQPPTPEWGSMLSAAKSYLSTQPWLIYIPGVCIVLTALSVNLIGDGLRDALDPKVRS